MRNLFCREPRCGEAAGGVGYGEARQDKARYIVAGRVSRFSRTSRSMVFIFSTNFGIRHHLVDERLDGLQILSRVVHEHAGMALASSVEERITALTPAGASPFQFRPTMR